MMAKPATSPEPILQNFGVSTRVIRLDHAAQCIREGTRFLPQFMMEHFGGAKLRPRRVLAGPQPRGRILKRSLREIWRLYKKGQTEKYGPKQWRILARELKDDLWDLLFDGPNAGKRLTMENAYRLGVAMQRWIQRDAFECMAEKVLRDTLPRMHVTATQYQRIKEGSPRSKWQRPLHCPRGRSTRRSRSRSLALSSTGRG